MTGHPSFQQNKTAAPGEILELFKGGYLSVAETIDALELVFRDAPAVSTGEPDEGSYERGFKAGYEVGAASGDVRAAVIDALEALSMWVTSERQKYRIAGGMPAGGFDNMTPIEVALAKVESEIDRRALSQAPATDAGGQHD